MIHSGQRLPEKAEDGIQKQKKSLTVNIYLMNKNISIDKVFMIVKPLRQFFFNFEFRVKVD